MHEIFRLTINSNLNAHSYIRCWRVKGLVAHIARNIHCPRDECMPWNCTLWWYDPRI